MLIFPRFQFILVNEELDTGEGEIRIVSDITK